LSDHKKCAILNDHNFGYS